MFIPWNKICSKKCLSLRSITIALTQNIYYRSNTIPLGFCHPLKDLQKAPLLKNYGGAFSILLRHKENAGKDRP